MVQGLTGQRPNRVDVSCFRQKRVGDTRETPKKRRGKG